MKNLAKALLLIMVMIMGLSLVTGMAAGQVKLVKGQTLYLPIATSYMTDDYSFNVNATIFIHNTDPDHAINIVKMDFYNTSGKLVEKYLQQPLKLNPSAGTRIRVKHSLSGEEGAAAHFIIQWQAETKVVEPLVRGLLLGSRGTRGYSFGHDTENSPGDCRLIMARPTSEPPRSNAIIPTSPWWASALWSLRVGRCCWCAGGRNRPKTPGACPGGLVELGETMAAAIHRELAEETGITVRLLGIAAVLERIFPDPDGRIAYHYVLVDFLVRLSGRGVDPRFGYHRGPVRDPDRPLRLRSAPTHRGRHPPGLGAEATEAPVCRSYKRRTHRSAPYAKILVLPRVLRSASPPPARPRRSWVRWTAP